MHRQSGEAGWKANQKEVSVLNELARDGRGRCDKQQEPREKESQSTMAALASGGADDVERSRVVCTSVTLRMIYTFHHAFPATSVQ